MTFLSDGGSLQPSDNREEASPPSSEDDYGRSSPVATPHLANIKKALSFTMFADIDPAPRKTYLVEGLIGSNETSAFAGAPGSGKSVLAGDLACHIAAGIPWLGRPVHNGAVIFLAAERSKLTERRFAAFRKHYKIDDLPLAIVAGAVDFLLSA
jgi:hypothetical protein